MATEQKIYNIIDYYLKRNAELGINMLPDKIEPEMADLNQNKDEEWRTWHFIESQVSDYDILTLEEKIGHGLPKDYKAFLKYKHFYELNISEVSFCRHPIRTWKDKLIEMNFDGYPTQYLIDKGFIVFADWSDWGLLCFNTNVNNTEHDYPIVLWDHERSDEVETKYSSFYAMMVAVDVKDRESQLED